jgi:hypothetical protein
MGIVEDTITHWHEERRSFLEWLSELESGQKQHLRKVGTTWVDVTQDLISQLKDRVGQLDRLLAFYEKPKAS